MNELKKISGTIAVVILLISLLIQTIKPEYTKYCWIAYGVGAAFLLFFIVANYKTLKEQFSGRMAKYGTYMMVYIMIVLVIVAFVNAIALRHGKQWDLTENKRFTLAEQTISVLKNLKEDITATGFFTEAFPGKMQVENLLKMYNYQNPKFKYDFIDPKKNPSVAEKNEITKDGTVVITLGSKTERVNYPDSGSEEALTNALIKMTRGGTKMVYFTTGHGEKSIGDQEENGFSTVKKQIESFNYVVKELTLARESIVPEDCSILVVTGPKTDFFDAELETLKKYIERPGNVFFMIDPGNLPKLMAFLEQYGVILKNTVVIDKFSRIMGGDALMPIVSTYTEHPVAKNLSHYMTFFPLARSIETPKEAPKNVKIERIFDTSPQSWAETNLEDQQAKFDDGSDVQGPITLAVGITIDIGPDQSPADKESKTKQAQILLFGDSDFANNSYFPLQKNGDLFMNAISFLGEEKDLIAIRPKSSSGDPLILTKMQWDLVWYTTIILLPAFVMGIGAAVYRSRRAKG